MKTFARMNLTESWHNLMTGTRESPRLTRLVFWKWPQPSKATSISQRDMDFLEQRKFKREEIMAALKMAKDELGIYNNLLLLIILFGVNLSMI
jgi:hypothetical protein